MINRILWLLLFALFMSAWTSAARAQGMNPIPQTVPHFNPHHSGIAENVDRFYQSWFIPALRQNSCCNKNDCAPTVIRERNGRYFAWNHFLRPNEEVEIEWERLEENTRDPRESPDGQSHVCMSPHYRQVLCAVRGQGY